MKLFSYGLLATAIEGSTSPSGRKVPPRHPLQRLNRLNDFIFEIMDSWGGRLAKTDPDKWVTRFGATTRRMETAFRRENKKCGFYNEENNGGNGGWKEGHENQESVTATSFNHGGYTPEEDDKDNILNQEHINYQGGSNEGKGKPNKQEIAPEAYRTRRDVGDGLDRYNRENPCQGIKNIINGYRKWSDRYLGQCGGQSKYEHHRRRALKWYGILVGPRGWSECTPESLGYKVESSKPVVGKENVASEDSQQLVEDSESVYGINCAKEPEKCTPTHEKPST